MKIRKILFLEPFDGGSHRAFREGLMARSRHEFRALTLPGRFWKWRMRGAAAYLADLINEGDYRDTDLLLSTGFLNLADLRGLLKPPLDRLPVVLYMHENQLTYPLSPQEDFDFHFGFTNILSALAATHVVFNSAWHRDLFLHEVPLFLNKMPEAVPRQVAQRLAGRCSVLGVGLDRKPLGADRFALYRGGSCDPDSGPPWPRGRRHRLIWNHRWEFDKRPGDFAAAVWALLDRGLDFEVALLGDPAGHPEVFAPLQQRLGVRCLAFGLEPDRARYEAILAAGDIVVSCADQEYFGISVAEAIHAGCYPVLPRRQVYPSLYGRSCQGPHFYDTMEDMTGLLARLLTGDTCGHVCSLDLDVDRYCWPRLVDRYDALLDRTAAGSTAERPCGEGGAP